MAVAFPMASDLESTLDLSLPAAVAVDPLRSSEVRSEVLRLFDDCAPGLRRYVMSFGLATESADDVVQEVFLALFRHLCLGRSRTNLRGWIFQVGHNLALKHRQQARRRQGAAWSVEEAEAVADPADTPEESIAVRQRQERLRSVMRALPDRDRRCLCLRAEGLRYRDIARTLGISLGSVAKSIARGLARLTNADIG